MRFMWGIALQAMMEATEKFYLPNRDKNLTTRRRHEIANSFINEPLNPRRALKVIMPYVKFGTFDGGRGYPRIKWLLFAAYEEVFGTDQEMRRVLEIRRKVRKDKKAAQVDEVCAVERIRR